MKTLFAFMLPFIIIILIGLPAPRYTPPPPGFYRRREPKSPIDSSEDTEIVISPTSDDSSPPKVDIENPWKNRVRQDEYKKAKHPMEQKWALEQVGNWVDWILDNTPPPQASVQLAGTVANYTEKPTRNGVMPSFVLVEPCGKIGCFMWPRVFDANEPLKNGDLIKLAGKVNDKYQIEVSRVQKVLQKRKPRKPRQTTPKQQEQEEQQSENRN